MHMAQENIIIVADALQALQKIADNTIDCCITCQRQRSRIHRHRA